MAISIEPVTPALGGIVTGIDLSRPLDEAGRKAVEAALHDRQVLFFRNQDITETVQRDFAAQFGPLHIHPIYPKSPVVPEIMVLDTALNDLRDNALWHSDVSFAETPPMGAVLVARKVPESGGDTLWASATAAYEGLSEPLKLMLDGQRALHDLAKSFPPERFATTEESRERLEHAKRTNPPVSHPVIRTHPATGRKAIFVNEGFTTRIEGMDADASDALLNLLYRHVTKPEYRCAGTGGRTTLPSGTTGSRSIMPPTITGLATASCIARRSSVNGRSDYFMAFDCSLSASRKASGSFLKKRTKKLLFLVRTRHCRPFQSKTGVWGLEAPTGPGQSPGLEMQIHAAKT